MLKVYKQFHKIAFFQGYLFIQNVIVTSWLQLLPRYNTTAINYDSRLLA